MANVHSTKEIGKISSCNVAGIVAFVVVALTWVPDWISPEGTNGSGNQPDAPGVGRTSRMIQ